MRHVPAMLALVSTLTALPGAARAQTVDVLASAYTTAIDEGPEDGTFDSYLAGYAAVVDNGWTSLRGGLLFDASAIPPDVTVQSATLQLSVASWEGERTLVVDVFADDGVQQLADFGRTGSVASVALPPAGTVMVSVDVTAQLADALATGAPALAVIAREVQQQGTNYLVLRVDAGVLHVDYTRDVVHTIGIDIKPGSIPNTISRTGRGVTAVAVLSDETFDVRSLDLQTVTFGHSGDEASARSCDTVFDDVNGDGLADVVCHFETSEAGFLATDTEGVLHGRTTAGTRVTGTDSLRIVR